MIALASLTASSKPATAVTKSTDDLTVQTKMINQKQGLFQILRCSFGLNREPSIAFGLDSALLRKGNMNSKQITFTSLFNELTVTALNFKPSPVKFDHITAAYI